MSLSKEIVAKKYGVPINKINDNQLEYYYTKNKLCCPYDLKPIKILEPFEFTKAIEYMFNHYYDLNCTYYRDLYEKTRDTQNNIYEYDTITADNIILEYLKFRPSISTIIIWPIAQSVDLDKFLAQYGHIYYKRTRDFTYNGAINLLHQLYADKPWYDLKWIKSKLDYLGWKENTNNNVTIIFFDNTSPHRLSGSQAPLKTMIREHIMATLKNTTNNTNLRGDDFLHANDHYYQVIEYSKIFLHDRTFKFITKQQLTNVLSFYKCGYYFNTLKKWMIANLDLVDYDRYLLMGNMALYAYGVKACGYIDGFVYTGSGGDNLVEKTADNFYKFPTKFFFGDFKLLGTKYWKSSLDDQNMAWFKTLKIINKEELIFNPNNYFYYNGIKILRLKYEMIRKYIRGTNQDLADLVAINSMTNIKIKLPKDINVDEIKKILKEKYQIN